MLGVDYFGAYGRQMEVADSLGLEEHFSGRRDALFSAGYANGDDQREERAHFFAPGSSRPGVGFTVLLSSMRLSGL